MSAGAKLRDLDSAAFPIVALGASASGLKALQEFSTDYRQTQARRLWRGARGYREPGRRRLDLEKLHQLQQ